MSITTEAIMTGLKGLAATVKLGKSDAHNAYRAWKIRMTCDDAERRGINVVSVTFDLGTARRMAADLEELTMLRGIYAHERRDPPPPTQEPTEDA